MNFDVSYSHFLAMSTNREQRLIDSIETAAHEVGHALVSLHYGASSAIITMLKTNGCEESSFDAIRNKCVHGTQTNPPFRRSPMDVAAIAYAGLIGMIMYYDKYGDLEEEDAFNTISTCSEWSKEDLEQINYVRKELHREVFGRAYKFLNDHYESLQKYTDYIAKDFADLNEPRCAYSLNAITFEPPGRLHP